MKQQQREIALLSRKSLTTEERRKHSLEICRKLSALPEIKAAKVVFSYSAMWDEVDISELHTMLWQQGKTLCFPVSQKGGVMKAYRVKSHEDLKPGCFGIMVPDENSAELIAPEDMDLVIAPCVAFDENCRRLGHGGGYYDRYLPLCKNAAVIAVAFEAQKLPCVFTDDYDVGMNVIVTEKCIYKNEGA